MAAKQSSSRSHKSGSKKKSSTGNKKKNTSPRFRWELEVILFVVLAFCVVLFIANFGAAGAVGAALSRFFFGLFGVMEYIFPVALFVLVAFLLANRLRGQTSKYHYPGRAIVKSLAGIVCFLMVCALCHSFYNGASAAGHMTGTFHISANTRAGGGILGAAISAGLIRGIGYVATIIVLFIIAALCVVLVSERSLFRSISRRVYRARDDARDRVEEEAENPAPVHRPRETRAVPPESAQDSSAEEASNGRTRRRDRRVSGITPDLTLTEASEKPEKASDIPDTGHMSEVDMSGYEYADGFEADPSEFTVVQPSAETSAETPPKRARKPKSSMADISAEVADVSEVVAAGAASAMAAARTRGDYTFPDIRLLKKGDPKKTGDSRQHLQEMSTRLQETLRTFGVDATVTNVVCGPTVTQYEVQPEMGVKVSKILNLADDIKLNLMVSDIRIEAPIPGKAAIGIEVPNQENVTVALRDIIESVEFQKANSGIWFCVGKDIAGNVITADIDKMPHLLIAGATGSGKSVCINTILMSLLYKYTPDEIKLIMIDPKMVELSVYNNIPHLLIPVVTDPKKAAAALHWAVAEMTERYNKFAEYGVRDIEGYNRKIESLEETADEEKPQRMSSIVVVVDELADLMMVAAGDVEDAICRLAQLARAAGIHLIIATQRPSVNVITGLIKANMPSRIAFSVTSGVDSRTILDMNGAEKLLGKGDMLFYPQGYAKPLRVQGAFVSDSEVAKVVHDVIAKNGAVSYNEDVEEQVVHSESALGTAGGYAASSDDRDVYFADAARFLIEKEKASIGMLQRNFKIGFNRAARIMDQLEEAGVVGPEEGTKPRQVLMTFEEFENLEE